MQQEISDADLGGDGSYTHPLQFSKQIRLLFLKPADQLW
jgi:hypothetical protein